MYKKIISLLLIFLLVFCMLAEAGAVTPIKVSVNGKNIKLSSQPYISSGIVYVPLTDTVVSLNISGSLYIRGNQISLVLNNIKSQFAVSSKTATINGKKVTLKNAPLSKNGVAFFPINLFTYFKINYTYKNNVVNFITSSSTSTGNTANPVYKDKYPIFVDGIKTELVGKANDAYYSTAFVGVKQLSAALGYKAEVLKDGLSVSFKNTTVIFYNNSDTYTQNGVRQKMKNTAVTYNGELLVPVTCLGDAFGIYSELNLQQNCIYIMNIPDKAGDLLLKSFRSNNGADKYFDFNINENILNVECKVLSNQWVLVEIRNGSSEPLTTYKQADTNGVFSSDIQLSGINDEKNTINIYTSPQEFGTYKSIYLGITLEKAGNDFGFPASPVLEDNQIQMNKDISGDTTSFTSKSGNKEISQLVEDITSGLSTEADKVKAIHDWVAGNIYYDEDAYNQGTASAKTVTAEYTLKNKRSVCEGYAELFMAMVRETGIPCRLVSGKAIWTALGETWDKVDKSDSNHAWNEVFLDGRWMIIDVTWDSGNKYENGEYTKGDIGYAYYDPTIEFFSLDHRIIGR